MLKIQVSIPELKAHAQAIRELARDPMKTLQGLAGGLRPRGNTGTNRRAGEAMTRFNPMIHDPGLRALPCSREVDGFRNWIGSALRRMIHD